jgi:hypothetical protein
MARQPETRLQQKIQKALKQRYGKELWIAKIHGGPFQRAGIPDLLICYRGRFISLEVKLPDKASSQPSEVQIETMNDIEAAGGYTAVVRSIEDAFKHVHRAVA